MPFTHPPHPPTPHQPSVYSQFLRVSYGLAPSLSNLFFFSFPSPMWMELETERSILKQSLGGAWVAQSVKPLTLDFGSGHGLTVHEFKPCVGLCAGRVEPAWNPLSPSFSAPPQI